MPTSGRTVVSSVNRRAQVAAFVAFATNGALVGSLLPRYPEIADALDLTTRGLGFAVVAFAVGAALAGRVPERPLRRFGTSAVTTVGTWAIAAAFIGAATVSNLGPGAALAFALFLGLAGYLDAIVDVAQNAEGLRVQQVLGRSVLTTMHAGWSAGAAVAGLVGATAAGLGVPLHLHLLAMGALCGVVVTGASRHFLPRQEEATVPMPSNGGARSSAPPEPNRRVLIASALIALAGLSVEAVGNDWSAWFVREVHDLGTDRAGFAVATVLGAQFAGRAIGDRAIDRLGEPSALRWSLVLVIAGLLSASWAPTAAMTFAGLAMAGFGSAITVPVAFASADRLPGLPPGRGIAIVAFAMRAATLTITPLVGIVGDAVGLRLAVSLVGGIAVAALLANWRTAP